MLPLAVLFAFQKPEVTADRAFTAGTKVLAAFDVPGPYVSLDLHREVEGRSPAVDVFRVSSSNGRTYRMSIVAATGQCRSVSVEQGPVYTTGKPPSPTAQVPSPLVAATGRSLARLGLLSDLLPDPWGRVTQYRDTLIYHVGYGGHPFFSPVKSYVDVRFDRPSGNFTGFHQEMNSPEPDRTPPRLSQAQAVEAARLYLATHEVRYYPSVDRPVAFKVGYDLPDTMPYNGPGPTIGWILPKGETRVRLAWAVPYWDRTMETPEGREAAGYVQDKSPNLLAKLYIDAATGKRVLSDEVAMERYP